MHKYKRKYAKHSYICIMKSLYFFFFCYCLPAITFAQTSQELFKQGQEAQTQKEYQKALEYFEQAAALDKTNPEIHAQISWTFIKLERYNKAIGAIKTAKKLNKKEAKYFYYHAVALDSMGRDREVLDITNKAMKINSDIAGLYILRANIYMRKKEYNTTIANLNKALELEPENAQAYLKRGYAKYRVVDSTGACADWRSALKLGEKDAQKFIDDYCKE